MNKKQILVVIALGLAPICVFAATDSLSNSVAGSIQSSINKLKLQSGNKIVGKSYAIKTKLWSGVRKKSSRTIKKKQRTRNYDRGDYWHP